MKRRTNPVKRSGRSSYERRAKIEYRYPGWVTHPGADHPMPREIEPQLSAARQQAGVAFRQHMRDERMAADD
jgi:hypothetical protein